MGILPAPFNPKLLLSMGLADGICKNSQRILPKTSQWQGGSTSEPHSVLRPSASPPPRPLPLHSLTLQTFQTGRNRNVDKGSAWPHALVGLPAYAAPQGAKHGPAEVFWSSIREAWLKKDRLTLIKICSKSIP